jgi:hypothetical protein
MIIRQKKMEEEDDREESKMEKKKTRWKTRKQGETKFNLVYK